METLDFSFKEFRGENGLVHGLGKRENAHEGILLVVDEINAKGNAFLDVSGVGDVDVIFAALDIFLFINDSLVVLVFVVFEVVGNICSNLIDVDLRNLRGRIKVLFKLLH